MSTGSYHSGFRTLVTIVAGFAVAVVPVLSVLVMPSRAGAAAEYANADVADIALKYVGRWGGNACADSRKPGDSGGQCRSFVNCVVWMASGGTQNLGGRDYFRPFLAAGGHEIASLDSLQKGDIVQEGHGRHTYIIVGRVSGNVFTVVDSNHRWNERVYTYDREVELSYNKRAFRMGITGPGVAGQAANRMMGALDTVEAVPGGVLASGWVIDGDVNRPVYGRLAAGAGAVKPAKETGVAVKANETRPDLAASYGRYGGDHGFRSFIVLPPGQQTVCLYGMNAEATAGEDVELGCKTVQVN